MSAAAKPAAPVQMKKTQPLITNLPTPVVTPAAINVARAEALEEEEEETVIEEGIPMSLCWALVAGSAVILLIQIWNYIS